jgi:heptosyltransferase-2/heptosyltransferase-3
MAAPDRRAALRQLLLRVAPGASHRAPANLATLAPTLPAQPRVLVLRPDHLGDLLFCGPALAGLRSGLPEARITLAVGPWSRPVAERLPGVDEVVEVDYPWFDRQPRHSRWTPYARLLSAARRLRRVDYDLALVLRDDHWWGAWLAALLRAPVRVGYQRPGVLPFLTHAWPGSPPASHAAAENLALVAALLGRPAEPASPATSPLSFQVSAADRAKADGLLSSLSVRPIALHPGSGAPVKGWRSGAWAETLAAIAAPGEAVVITGGAAELPLAEAVAAASARPVINLAGLTDLGTLAAVFARCRLVLGPDSGPLHLAVAVGTPTVHLFGPADARRFGPWGAAERHQVVVSNLPCVPCGRLDWPDPAAHPCVRSLAVARVIAAARSCEAQGRTL